MSAHRSLWLCRQVRIEPGHWCGWDLLTYPNDLDVELSEDLAKAKVAWSLFSLGGLTAMQRKSGEWSIEASCVMGIE